MASLLNPKTFLLLRRASREARRRGVRVDDLPADVVATLMLPKVNMARWGLPANDEVSADTVYRDQALANAVAAAAGGLWLPAAELLASTWGDWAARADVVRALGDAAAADDTWLSAWRAARPQDPGHAVVLARMLIIVAWQVRGAQRGVDTTREQFVGFRRVLLEARQAAITAAEVAPDDPTPWWTHINLARGLSYEHDEFLALWSELLARDPLHRHAHVQALQYWCRKWRGSDDLMTEFAATAAATSPTLAVLPLQAAFEHDDDRWRDQDVVAALDTLLTRLPTDDDTPDTRDDRGWAISALMANDRHDEAVVQFRALGTRADGQPWSFSESPVFLFLQTRTTACANARRP
ncbi:DUF4034 domain-containing protein [Actinokineospora cianjurensis]|uniref:DUF4034 domain-containing protein n=1 Tax=Actinokineospora cianjurensis TaxID=585224 RepID=A0A421B3G9_9PSEU|nr:DUF4034 domain-containing protein [Actinokineospora cianjurensis]RLK58972.1 hypothetical protein CLV68_3453 [Actinokineospora cianjurensis]